MHPALVIFFEDILFVKDVDDGIQLAIHALDLSLNITQAAFDFIQTPLDFIQTAFDAVESLIDAIEALFDGFEDIAQFRFFLGFFHMIALMNILARSYHMCLLVCQRVSHKKEAPVRASRNEV